MDRNPDGRHHARWNQRGASLATRDRLDVLFLSGRQGRPGQHRFTRSAPCCHVDRHQRDRVSYLLGQVRQRVGRQRRLVGFGQRLGAWSLLKTNRGEPSMPAYWVARSKINDPVEYKKYTDLVPAIIAKYGGKVLARGGKFQIMEGPQKFQRFVVIEFPTFAQGVACFTSKEYDAAAAFRRRNGAGEVETIMVDGGDATT